MDFFLEWQPQQGDVSSKIGEQNEGINSWSVISKKVAHKISRSMACPNVAEMIHLIYPPDRHRFGELLF